MQKREKCKQSHGSLACLKITHVFIKAARDRSVFGLKHSKMPKVTIGYTTVSQLALQRIDQQL